MTPSSFPKCPSLHPSMQEIHETTTFTVYILLPSLPGPSRVGVGDGACIIDFHLHAAPLLLQRDICDIPKNKRLKKTLFINLIRTQIKIRLYLVFQTLSKCTMTRSKQKGSPKKNY